MIELDRPSRAERAGGKTDAIDAVLGARRALVLTPRRTHAALRWGSGGAADLLFARAEMTG